MISIEDDLTIVMLNNNTPNNNKLYDKEYDLNKNYKYYLVLGFFYVVFLQIIITVISIETHKIIIHILVFIFSILSYIIVFSIIKLISYYRLYNKIYKNFIQLIQVNPNNTLMYCLEYLYYCDTLNKYYIYKPNYISQNLYYSYQLDKLYIPFIYPQITDYAKKKNLHIQLKLDNIKNIVKYRQPIIDNIESKIKILNLNELLELFNSISQYNYIYPKIDVLLKCNDIIDLGNSIIDADTLINIYIYLIILCDIPHFCSEIFIIRELLPPELSINSIGYILTSIDIGLKQIINYYNK